MLYMDLLEYYQTIHLLSTGDYKYPPQYIEELIPFEREILIGLIMQDETKAAQGKQTEAPVE